jgi:hypothetical protein
MILMPTIEKLTILAIGQETNWRRKMNKNDSAFPAGMARGLTKREYFAALAMNEMIHFFATNPNECSRLAVMQADALIAELAKEE